MVLLDYIANKGLRLPREGSSDPALWARLRAAADARRRRRRLPARRRRRRSTTTTRRSCAPAIPAIDLIDFSYRYAARPAGHARQALGRSLDAVGETVFALVSELRAG